MPTALYSLDRLRKPDESQLPVNTEKIMEALNTPKKYFQLVREMEDVGLEGNLFDDAFGCLRDAEKISINETFVVHRV